MDSNKTSQDQPDEQEDPWDDPAVQESLRRVHGSALFTQRYIPSAPVDRSRVEDVGKQVQHDPAQWSKGMLKAMIAVAVVGALLVLWALLSLR